MANTMWGGRFAQNQNQLFDAFNSSLSSDYYLLNADILGSKAHVKGLVRAGILSDHEGNALITALDEIGESTENECHPLEGAEDVHMWLELQLTNRLGSLGKKVHTGRSRNDQVAAAMKLWLKGTVIDQLDMVGGLARTLLVLAKTYYKTPMPGYTHLQPAQPITFGYHLLTYVAMLVRDYQKGMNLLVFLNQCPLGAGALAGSTYAIDRDYVASQMGMEALALHAMDAISDRDYILDYLFWVSQGMLHLSRLAEEMVMWSNPQFGYLELSDAWTSGSSMMPNKKNPDACELIRGKSGTSIGRLTGMLATIKGLPLAYNKDLQEDKHAILSAAKDFELSLLAMKEQLSTATYHEGAMKKALGTGYVNATDLADWLVLKGLPFRDAHHISGQMVSAAIQQGQPLEGLDAATYSAQIEGVIGSEASRLFTDELDWCIELKSFIALDACIERRQSKGGTSPNQVLDMINVYTQELQGLQASLDRAAKTEYSFK